MTVRDTSIEAFHTEVANGNYETHQDAVVACIDRFGPMTRREVSSATRIEYGSVCSAANALVKDKVLMDPRTRKNKTTKKKAHILERYNRVVAESNRKPEQLSL